MLDADRNQVDLLAEEFASRLRRGETPAINDYVQQHPGLKNEIEELFPTIAALEGLRRKRERPADGRASLGPAKLQRLGDFRILREIGRGGMGVVYEAEQESLSRRVAVKVLPKQSLLDERHLRRFQREARTAARLHHTNIVPILAVGVHDGFHYYAMQIIDGVGLDQIIQRMAEESGELSSDRLSELWHKYHIESGRDYPDATALVDTNDFANSSSAPIELGATPTVAAVPPSAAASSSTSTPSPTSSSAAQPQRSITARSISPSYWQNIADIGVQAASALSYAHQHGVLHRDIKPGNLILDESGIVWVADFGLAKASEQEAVSRTGDIVGTLRFMAPEQLRGDADARSDIYALGLTLYEMLTLQPAHRESTRKQALLTGHPVSQVPAPRKLNPAIPLDLETIILKAIADDPGRRYQTAEALAEDLHRFLEDLPILARRAGAPERFWRWSRRNPAVAGLSALAATLLVMVAVIATIGYFRTQHALAQESLQRERAEAAVAVSLEALDRVYERFAPDRVLVDSNVSIGEDGEENRVQLPAQPELSPESVALLQDLLKSYDKLAELDMEDANLQIEVAKANRRLGDIYQRLDQAKEAMTAYQKAIELTDELIPSIENREQRIALETNKARIRNDLGSVYRRMGERFTAVQTFHASLESLESLMSQSTAPEVRFELARTNYLLSGGSFGNSRLGMGPPPSFGFPRGRRPDGMRRGERTPDHRPPPPGETGPAEAAPPAPTDPAQPGPPQPPPAPDFTAKGPPRPFPGLTKGAGGSKWSKKGFGERKGPGREEFKRSAFRQIDDEQTAYLSTAIELLTGLQREHPSVPEYPRMLALCYREQFRTGNTSAIAQAIEVLSQLVEAYPHVDDYRYDLAVTMGASAMTDPDNVEKILRQAIQHARQLDTQSPAFAVALADMCSALAVRLAYQSPESVSDQQILDEVQHLLEEAVQLHSRLVKTNPDTESYRGRAANSLQLLARFLTERSSDDVSVRRAESLLAQAAEHLEVLLERRDTNPIFAGLHWPLANIHERRASYLSQLSLDEQAKQATADAAAHRAKLAQWHSRRSKGRWRKQAPEKR